MYFQRASIGASNTLPSSLMKTMGALPPSVRMPLALYQKTGLEVWAAKRWFASLTRRRPPQKGPGHRVHLDDLCLPDGVKILVVGDEDGSGLEAGRGMDAVRGRAGPKVGLAGGEESWLEADDFHCF